MTARRSSRRHRHKPHYPPLTPEAELKAREYMRMCEQGEHKHLFKNFENDLVNHIYYREYTDCFGSTFLEYVIVEETIQDVLGREHCPGDIRFLVGKLQLWRLRRECKALWGMTPKYHARYHREVIHQAKKGALKPGLFDKFTDARHRRELS